MHQVSVIDLLVPRYSGEMTENDQQTHQSMQSPQTHFFHQALYQDSHVTKEPPSQSLPGDLHYQAEAMIHPMQFRE